MINLVQTVKISKKLRCRDVFIPYPLHHHQPLLCREKKIKQPRTEEPDARASGSDQPDHYNKSHIFYILETTVINDVDTGSININFDIYKQPVQKQLAVRNKCVKQLTELDHLARSNNEKSIENNFCNIASKKSLIVPQFPSISYLFLEKSLNFLNPNILKIYRQFSIQSIY